jgi:type VI secretion system secreted protein Hcp
MASDMFLKLSDIVGESKDQKYSKQIDIASWSWGIHNTSDAHISGGAGAGKASVHDLSFSKYVDKATPSLIDTCFRGTHIKDGQLIIRKAGGKDAVEYLLLDMKIIFITSYSLGGSGGESRCVENITIAFQEFEWSYQAQDEKGAKDGGVVKKKFNILKNTAG